MTLGKKAVLAFNRWVQVWQRIAPQYNLMKGSASVNPVFTNFHIQYPTVYCAKPLIATDHHNLYLGSAETSAKWEHKSIISCCYSAKYGALLALSESGRLHVFTEQLQEITRIPWEAKYSVGLELIDSMDMFLMIGATQVQLQYVRIHSNFKSTKFVSSMTFGVEKKDKYICEPDTKLQWNKGYNYDLPSNLLYLWSSRDINFYSLDKLKLHSHIGSLTRKELSITYVLYNSHYKYTITGLINGHVKVWRLNEMKNSLQKDYILIHNYIRHAKSIDKIVKGIDHRVIITSSSELIVCFWSLETFEQLREYNFLGEYSRIILHNYQFSYAIRDSSLGQLHFGKTLQFVTSIASQIISVDKGYQFGPLGAPAPVQSLQITLASNMGFRLCDHQLNNKDLNKANIEYIYPPLKAKGIHQIVSSPHTENQYYLLVENGEVFRLRIEEGSGRIEESYSIERSKDVEMHQLSQMPTIIKFLPFVPPQFDSEINENTFEKKKPFEGDQSEEYHHLRLLAVGCNKGTVVFLRTTNFQQIYSRVTYHREAITGMESFRANGCAYLATTCSEEYLKIVRFDSEKAACIKSIHVGSTLKWMKGFEDRLALVLQKGMFEIFTLDANEKDHCILNQKSEDHEQQVMSLDADPQNKLIVTAGLDNRIKIWTYNKVLIYQVFLDEGLKSAIWFRSFELLVSHNLKVLYFRNIGLKVKPAEIQDANEEAIELAEDSPSIGDIIKKVSALKEDIKFHLLKGSQSGEEYLRKSDVKVEEQSPKKAKRRSSKVKRNEKRGTEESSRQQSQMIDSDLEAMRKHMEEMKKLKKEANESILPKIRPRSEDAFDSFMKAKLLNKKVLTRRDITLNRIIMKNIIREHFGPDSDITSNLKLDF